MFSGTSRNFHSFQIAGSRYKGSIEAVADAGDIDQENARRLLVEGFIAEYGQYLLPEDIDPSLTSWRVGENSVQRYYEKYFATELAKFTEGKIHFWVCAYVGLQLAGFATFERDKNNAVYMDILVVDPAYQRHGIGEQLVKSLLNLSVMIELTAVHVLLRAKNRGGKKFYEKLGFLDDETYTRTDNYVDRSLLEPITWKNPKALSVKKGSFMARRNYSSHIISVSELPALKTFYAEKGVVIHINGETDEGARRIAARQTASPIAQEIEEIKNPDRRFAAFFRKMWGGIRDGYEKFAMCYICCPVNEIVDNSDALRIKLNQAGFKVQEKLFYKDEVEDETLLNHSIIKACRELNIYIVMESQIGKYQETLEKNLSDVGLAEHEVVQEVRAIQSRLNENEFAGYIYTNGHVQHTAHIEVLILTKDSIIKPVHWTTYPKRIITPYHFTDMFMALIDRSIVVSLTEHKPVLAPQTQGNECATQGIVYLKELLKHNAAQLKENTLQFCYYHQGVLKHLFVTSPQTLRYSQSTLYNKAIHAMMQSVDEFEFEHDDEKYRVKTLQALFKESIRYAEEIKDSGTVRANIALLVKLPEFSKKWLALYAIHDVKRTSMFDTSNLNRYLACKTHGMRDKARKAQEQTLAML